jgi:hypothetical protein
MARRLLTESKLRGMRPRRMQVEDWKIAVYPPGISLIERPALIAPAEVFFTRSDPGHSFCSSRKHRKERPLSLPLRHR